MLDKLNRNIADVRSFGPGVLGRHLARITRARHVDLTLRQVGKVRIHADDSHISSIRQVFDDQQYRLGGTFEKRTRAAYDAMLGAGVTPVIVEAGANIGAALLWFARTYPEAVILAIEPEDENYGLLARNVTAHSSIRPVKAAVGGESGFVDVHAALNSTDTVTTQSDAGTPMITIAGAVAKVAGGRLFIAKIDIEGFEQDLFAGDVEWIDDAQIVYVEPHDWMLPQQGTSRPFLKAFASRDFDMLSTHENLAFVR